MSSSLVMMGEPVSAFDHFLPSLSFDSSTLQLVASNSAACRLFGDDLAATTAAALFRENEQQDAQGLKQQLEDLVDQTEASREQPFESSLPVTLHYWTGPPEARGAHLAEVLCLRCPAINESASSNSSTYDILFLRLIPQHSASEPSGVAQPTSAGSSLRSASPRPATDRSFPVEPDVLDKFHNTVFKGVKDKTDATLRAGGGLDLKEHDLVKVLDTFPTIAFVADAAGSTEMWTRAWFSYTGVDKDPSTWVSAFHPDELGGSVAHWMGEVAKGAEGVVHWEYRIRSKEGEWRWHLCEGRPIVSNGKAVRWVATITDIHDLVTTKEEALRSQELFQAVMASSNTVLLCVDKDFIITFWSGTSRVLDTAQTDEMVGAPLDKVCLHQHLTDGCRRILNEELDILVVECISSPGEHSPSPEERCIKYTLCPLTDADGSIPGVIIVGADTTESKRTEAALRQSQLERADLLASEHAAREASKVKSSFMSSMTHELRTPVAGIIGLCELLLDDPTLQAEHRKMVDKALRTGGILLDLVGLVLDMAKIEADKLTLERNEFDLAAVVDDVRLFSVLAAKNGVEFVEDFGDEWYSGPLLGDAMRLRQVLTNGISNSIKFTKQGSVILRFRQESETAEEVRVSFVIEDTGVGIAPDVLPTLFKAFSQADSSTAREFGGTGLGLVITKRLVELMGGTVELTSTLGAGTTMTVKLAFAKAHPNSPSGIPRSLSPFPSPRLSHSPGLSSSQRANGAAGGLTNGDTEEVLEEDERRRRSHLIRILLAEDNELIREIVVRTLTKLKFQVDAVTDGLEAVEAVRNGHYDLVLMDGQMPRMDGYEATRQIRKLDSERATVKVVALTASAIVGDMEKCLEAGMSSYLSKPVRARDLDLKIWEQLLLAEQEKERGRSQQ